MDERRPKDPRDPPPKGRKYPISHKSPNLQSKPSEPPVLDLGQFTKPPDLTAPPKFPPNFTFPAPDAPNSVPNPPGFQESVPPMPPMESDLTSMNQILPTSPPGFDPNHFRNDMPPPDIPPISPLMQPMQPMQPMKPFSPVPDGISPLPSDLTYSDEITGFTEDNFPFSRPAYSRNPKDLPSLVERESAQQSLRTDTTNSFMLEPDNKSYVDTELERHVFTYGPYTPSRISQSSVPRPQAMTLNPESETLYETTKNYGLIPTFGNQKVIDTGSANPIYITPTHTELPMFGGTLNDMKLPFGVLVQPFAENEDELVPELDFLSFMEKRSKTKRDLIRCKNCQAYYNPNMNTKSRSNFRHCNFCYTSFKITDEQLEAIDKINAKYRENSPLKKGTIDFVAPTHYYKKEPEQGAISSLFNRASSIGIFKQPQRQESLIYDTYSVSPVPADPAGNFNAYPNNEKGNELQVIDLKIQNEQEQNMNLGNREEDQESPNCPSYIFIVESTSKAIKLDMKHSVLTGLMNALDEIRDESFNLCVLVYDSALYTFPTINENFSVSVVTEVDETFTPCTPSELFVKVTWENHDEVKDYLAKVLTVQTIKSSPNSCGNFALSCAVRILNSQNCYGTISIFYSTQPDTGIGTDPQLFPASNFTLSDLQKHFYDVLLQMCYASGICVDVYLCPPETRIPGDVALQYISQQTGGKCTYIPRFMHKYDCLQVQKEMVRLFTAPCGYKCELKLRTSKHIKVTEVLCGFHNTRAVKNYTTLSVPRIGPDLSIGFMLSLHDLVDNKSSLYLQCACLYTNTRGVQMVRVHTQTLRVISSINEIFKNTNPDAIMNLLSRKLAHSYIKTGKYNRDHYLNKIVEALTAYRHICAPSTPKNQLILPDNLKLLPAYLNSILKYDITGEYGFEFVIKLLSILNSSVKITYFLYTRTYNLHRSVYQRSEEVPEQGFTFTLNSVPSASSFIYSDGIYLMDDGYKLLIFIGPHVRTILLKQLFGPDYEFQHVYVNSTDFADTPTSRNLLKIVEQIRAQHKGCPYMPLKILTYTAKNSKYIKTLLLEDEFEEEPSYINFLVAVHKKILDSGDKIY